MNATETKCYDCKRTLAPGESAWCDEWHVVTPEGAHAETRYHCDDCSAVDA